MKISKIIKRGIVTLTEKQKNAYHIALSIHEPENFWFAFNKAYALLSMRERVLIPEIIYYLELAEKFKTNDQYNDDINKAWEQIYYSIKNHKFKDEDEYLAYIEKV